jgi:RNA polymerase sigma-70 factor, ECF subfamily
MALVDISPYRWYSGTVSLSLGRCSHRIPCGAAGMGYDGIATQPSGSGMPGSTSSSLLALVKAGNAIAWQRLLEVYTPLVYQWCRHGNLQEDDAADVAQEVFVAVARGIGDFRRERAGGSFRGWLWMITRNKIRDSVRRRHGLPQARGGTEAQVQLAQVADNAPEPSTQDFAVRHEGSLQRRALELIRASVEPRTWDAFWRVTAEGRDPDFVAQDLGLTVKAVYDANYRVRRKLRNELEGLIE